MKKKRRFGVACLRSLLQSPKARVVSELPQGAVEPFVESLGRNTKPILKMHEELRRQIGGSRDRTAE